MEAICSEASSMKTEEELILKNNSKNLLYPSLIILLDIHPSID